MKKYILLVFLLILLKIATAGTDYSPLTYKNTIGAGNAGLNGSTVLMSGYAVTFTIYNGDSVLAGASVTFKGENLVSDSNGVVVFTQVPAGSISFLVSAAGYEDNANDTYITGDQPVNVYMNKLCSLHFTITDGSNPLQGAKVVINGDTAIADADGIATFGKIFPGNSTYSYTVSAAGYADSTATADIGSSDLIIGPIPLKKAYSITITVTDSLSNPIEGALVTNNSDAMLTDSDGSAVFIKKINGNYSYVISMSGYIDYAANITVANADITATVVLSSGFEVIITIINGPNGTTPLEGDTLTLNGITKITDGSGNITFGLHPGMYPFTVHKTGFADTSLSLEVVDQNLALTVYLTPSYTVIFNVADAQSYNPIEAASVTFNGITKLSDVIGNVAFMGVAPSDSNIAYRVNASGGYFVDTGSVSLPFTSVSVNDMNTISQSVYLVRPGIVIVLAEGMMSYFGPATIRVDGVDYSYDTGLGMSFLTIDTGRHKYTVIPDDVNKAIVSGYLTVGTSGSDFLQVEIMDAYKVEIYAMDPGNNPITGAAVIFDNDTALTDNTGDAIFNRKAANSYTYSITSAGFDSIPATALDVNSADVVEIVHMNPNVFTITIIVSDASGFVSDASVSLNGPIKNKGSEGMSEIKSNPVDSTIIITGADGKAIFTGKPAGEYSFTIVKSGYVDSTGFIAVTNMDVTQTVLIVVTGLKDNYRSNLQPYPNPTTNSVYLSIPSELNHAVVSVISVNGACMQQSVHENEQGTVISVDLKELPSGIYMIEIAGKQFRKTWSVAKK